MAWWAQLVEWLWRCWWPVKLHQDVHPTCFCWYVFVHGWILFSQKFNALAWGLASFHVSCAMFFEPPATVMYCIWDVGPMLDVDWGFARMNYTAPSPDPPRGDYRKLETNFKDIKSPKRKDRYICLCFTVVFVEQTNTLWGLGLHVEERGACPTGLALKLRRS